MVDSNSMKHFRHFLLYFSGRHILWIPSKVIKCRLRITIKKLIELGSKFFAHSKVQLLNFQKNGIFSLRQPDFCIKIFLESSGKLIENLIVEFFRYLTLSWLVKSYRLQQRKETYKRDKGKNDLTSYTFHGSHWNLII